MRPSELHFSMQRPARFMAALTCGLWLTACGNSATGSDAFLDLAAEYVETCRAGDNAACDRLAALHVEHDQAMSATVTELLETCAGRRGSGTLGTCEADLGAGVDDGALSEGVRAEPAAPVSSDQPPILSDEQGCLDSGATWNSDLAVCHLDGEVFDPETGDFTGEVIDDLAPAEVGENPNPADQPSEENVPSGDVTYGAWSGIAYVDVDVYDYCADGFTLSYARTDHYEYRVDLRVSEPMVHLEAGLVEHAESNPVHLSLQTSALNIEGAFALSSAEAVVTGQTGSQMVRDLMDVSVDGNSIAATITNSGDRIATNLTFAAQSSDPCGIGGSAISAMVPAFFADGGLLELQFQDGRVTGHAELVTRAQTRLLSIQLEAEPTR